MTFLLADSFTASLARLTSEEQKAVKTTAFDLQMNPASPGMQLHRLARAKDANFWSVRATSDLRLIVHKTDQSLLLCYADHHDAAYDWAERRRLERHPVTGAMQFVEIRETVREIQIPRYVDAPPVPARVVASARLFDAVSDARPFSNAEHNRSLRERLNGRSKGSVEFKYANVSAVLPALGEAARYLLYPLFRLCN